MKKYEGMKFDINDSIALLSINTHQIVRSDHAKTDDRINTKTLNQIGSPSSLIIAPLFHDGKSVGALSVVAKKVKEFDDLGVQAVRILAGLMGYAISQQLYQEKNLHLCEQQSNTMHNLKKTEKELEFSVHHDYLTGLPNRQLFNEQLATIIKKAKRKKQLMALLYLDIDHFKNINETFGPAMGDKLLSAFALRLKHNVRASDIIARLGGDEFVLLADDIKEAQDAIVIVDKIMQAMRNPFPFNKQLIHLTISIGIAFLTDFSITADEFIKQADQALYISKNSGRNTFYIFNSELLHETS
jgi:diguanylate cyclase (GGDEF)-like protein